MRIVADGSDTFAEWGDGFVQFEKAREWFENRIAIPIIVKTQLKLGEDIFILIALHNNGNIFDVLKKYRIAHMSWKNCSRAVQAVQEIHNTDLVLIWTGNTILLKSSIELLRSYYA